MQIPTCITMRVREEKVQWKIKMQLQFSKKERMELFKCDLIGHVPSNTQKLYCLLQNRKIILGGK